MEIFWVRARAFDENIAASKVSGNAVSVWTDYIAHTNLQTRLPDPLKL
jgi:hypothetical protein